MTNQTPITRWTPLRKAALLTEISTLTQKQANKLLKFHGISMEELIEWRTAMAKSGLQALRTTRLHSYQPSRAKHLKPSKFNQPK